MSVEPEHDLNDLLRGHLSRQLDGQLGRARTAIDRLPHVGRRSFHIGWPIGLAAAAAVALVAALGLFEKRLSSKPVIVAATTAPIPSASEDPTGTLERTTWWQTVDAGTVFLDDDTPATKLIHQQVQRVQWTDASGQQSVESILPIEQVVYVPLNRY